jgi:hypothetical protein
VRRGERGEGEKREGRKKNILKNNKDSSQHLIR